MPAIQPGRVSEDPVTIPRALARGREGAGDCSDGGGVPIMKLLVLKRTGCEKLGWACFSGFAHLFKTRLESKESSLTSGIGT